MFLLALVAATAEIVAVIAETIAGDDAECEDD